MINNLQQDLAQCAECESRIAAAREQLNQLAAAEPEPEAAAALSTTLEQQLTAAQARVEALEEQIQLISGAAPRNAGGGGGSGSAGRLQPTSAGGRTLGARRSGR
jgi:ABC-type hemin transport system substrate-binding protein